MCTHLVSSTEVGGKSLPATTYFSLVLATLDRTAELANFLAHLDQQSNQQFEIIIVDQNVDDRLEPVLAPYKSRFSLKHLRSPRGLSRARNVGLRYASGKIVAFPDDDCWYEASTLERISRLFSEHPEWDGITGRAKAERAFQFFDSKEGFLDTINVWRRAISFTVFLRSSVIKEVGEFDPLLGVGSGSGFESGEETDYLLRAIKKHCRIYYRPDLIIHHADMPTTCDRNMRQKAYGYGRGLGRTVRKHNYPFWFLSYVLLRSAGGALLSASKRDFAKASYHLASLRGRLSGWRA